LGYGVAGSQMGLAVPWLTSRASNSRRAGETAGGDQTLMDRSTSIVFGVHEILLPPAG
jgi:hypothetical protein